MTLGSYFTHLRETLESEKITYAVIAKRAGIHLSVCQHLSKDRYISAQTLKKILLRGLKLKRTQKEYQRMIALWMEHYFGEIMEPTAISAAVTGDRQTALDGFAKQVIPLLPRVAKEHRGAVVEALDRPDVLTALTAMVKIRTKK
jgi:hypothetical protein